MFERDFLTVAINFFASSSSLALPRTSPVCALGESLYVGFSTVAFARNGKTKQPDIKVSLRVLDEKGKPTMPQPLSGRANKGIPENLKFLPMQFGITMNRPGRFTVELTAVDQISGKSSTVRFPIRAIALD